MYANEIENGESLNAENSRIYVLFQISIREKIRSPNNICEHLNELWDGMCHYCLIAFSHFDDEKRLFNIN
jgi:hypothetical protein